MLFSFTATLASIFWLYSYQENKKSNSKQSNSNSVKGNNIVIKIIISCLCLSAYPWVSTMGLEVGLVYWLSTMTLGSMVLSFAIPLNRRLVNRVFYSAAPLATIIGIAPSTAKLFS